MYPTIYETPGGVGIHPYGLMILLAFCAAFGLVYWRSIQIGFHPDKLIGVYIASAVGGMLGARLLYAIAVEPAKTLANPASIFAFSGFAMYGGLIGGALGVGAVSKALDLNTWKMADVAAPAVLLAMGIGRIGCFFAGCCHGAEMHAARFVPLLPEGLLHGQVYFASSFPFLACRFDDGVTAAELQHLPLYPTQLIEVLILPTLALVMSSLWHKRRFDGQIAAIALLCEPPTRILVEAFRADHRGYAFTFPVIEPLARLFPGMTQAGAPGSPEVMGLTTSQFLGLLLMGLGASILVLRRNAGVAPEIPVAVDPDLEPVSQT
jgi:phosphatidylglycerol:prolipoprotein diacylglycerol transferase